MVSEIEIIVSTIDPSSGVGHLARIIVLYMIFSIFDRAQASFVSLEALPVLSFKYVQNY
jgi:hypothetical protein